MFTVPVKVFVHPHSVYRLEHPAHWDVVNEKDGESVGFGPHERDDVGLWISVLPFSIDTDRMPEDLPAVMAQATEKAGAKDVRRDPGLRHYGLIADMDRDGQGGNYWLVAGGDVVLFASTQVPEAERDEWNPLFHKVMHTLKITRDEELAMRQLANEVLSLLRDKHPDEDFQFEGSNIKGKRQVVYLSNLYREIRSSPSRKEKIIKRFVDTLTQPATTDMGHEEWNDIIDCVVPILKPREYFKSDGPTRHLHTTDWLGDVQICYAINREKMFRFITGWDINRWEITPDLLHKTALANLAKLPWPTKIPGSSHSSGHVIVVDTNDSLTSSRLLHPDLHKLFSKALGSPFRAAIPCRGRLVLYSNTKQLAKKIDKKVKKDHDSSSYQITPRPFLVTADGIAFAAGE